MTNVWAVVYQNSAGIRYLYVQSVYKKKEDARKAYEHMCKELVKLNSTVKGSESSWDDPDGSRAYFEVSDNYGGKDVVSMRVTFLQ